MHHVRNGGLSVECVLGECSLLSVGVGFDSVFTVFSVVCVCPDYMPIIDTSWGECPPHHVLCLDTILGTLQGPDTQIPVYYLCALLHMLT